MRRKATSIAEWSGMTLLTLGGAALLIRPFMHARRVIAALIKH